MPYQLPPQPFSDALRWFLVAIPDEAEFVRAALGAYTEPIHSFMWGEEGPEPGSEPAAELWQTAVDATMWAWENNVLQQLLEHIDEIEPILRAIRDRPCCDGGNVSFDAPGAGPNPVPDIEDGVGDPPPTWGGDPLPDPGGWEGFLDMKCQGAHFVVDMVAEKLLQFDAIRDWAVPIHPDELASLIAWAPALGAYIAVPWKLFTALFYVAWDNLIGLDAAAASVLAAKDEIACAIFEADGAEEAVGVMRDAVVAEIGGLIGSAIAYYLDYETYIHIVYTGTATNREGEVLTLLDHVSPGEFECCPPVVSDFVPLLDLTMPGHGFPSEWIATRERGINDGILDGGTNMCGSLGNFCVDGLYIGDSFGGGNLRQDFGITSGSGKIRIGIIRRVDGGNYVAPNITVTNLDTSTVVFTHTFTGFGIAQGEDNYLVDFELQSGINYRWLIAGRRFAIGFITLE